MHMAVIAEYTLPNGRVAARTVRHAWILLQADAGPAGPAWSDAQIRAAFGVSGATIARVRHAVVEEGLDAALYPKRPAPRLPAKIDGANEAHLVALACSAPPDGRERWTLRLLEKKVVELQIVDRASDSTIGRALKKTFSGPIAGNAGSSRRRPTARS